VKRSRRGLYRRRLADAEGLTLKAVQDSPLIIGRIWRWLEAHGDQWVSVSEIQQAVSPGSSVRQSIARELRRLELAGLVKKQLVRRSAQGGLKCLYSLTGVTDRPVQDWLAQGYTPDQVSELVGIGRQAVMRRAKRAGVRVPRDNRLKMRPERVLQTLIESLDCLIPSDELLAHALEQPIAPELAAELDRAVHETMRKLRKAMTRIMEKE
jgi:predicted transcriptional regulator